MKGNGKQHKKLNQRKKPKSKAKPHLAMSSETAKFAQALINPFHAEAFGARIPDLYSTPTIPLHCRNTITVTSGTAGAGSAVCFLPNPICTYLQLQGNITGQGIGYSIGPAAGMVPSGDLADQCEEFRVVGFGLRISNLQPPGTAVGRILVTAIPGLNRLPNEQALSAEADTAATWTTLTTGAFGLPGNSSGLFAGLANYPSTEIFTVQELMANDIIVNSHVTSADYYRFRPAEGGTTGMILGGTQYYHAEDMMYNSATSAPNLTYAGTNKNLDLTGLSCIIVQLEGVPNSAECLTIEVTLHMEAIPVNGVTSYFAGGESTSSPMDPDVCTKIIAASCREPACHLMSAARAHGRGVLKGAAKGLASMVMAKFGIPGIL